MVYCRRALLVVCVTLLVLAQNRFSDAYILTSAEDLRLREYAFTFEEYMSEYGKSYEADEMEMRRALFERRLAEIREHNEDPVRSRLWKKGLNSHTDRTEEELRMLRGYDRALGHQTRRRLMEAKHAPIATHEDGKPARANLPTSLDWRKVPGVVTSIKDQGNCGSCWAFAATATIESHWAIATGRVADLSVQSIVSCAPNPNKCGGTGGCNGGTAQIGFQYAQEHGLVSEWQYSYLQYFNNSTVACPEEPLGATIAVVDSYVNVLSNSLDAVMQALQIGPLAIAIDASKLHHYESGIYHGCDPKNTTLDHGVVLVGYGTEVQPDGTEQPYWIIRNSWGTDVGEDGYYRFLRELDVPACGTDLDPSQGTACASDPVGPITVCGTCGLLYDTSYPYVSSRKKEPSKHDV